MGLETNYLKFDPVVVNAGKQNCKQVLEELGPEVVEGLLDNLKYGIYPLDVDSREWQVLIYNLVSIGIYEALKVKQ